MVKTVKPQYHTSHVIIVKFSGCYYVLDANVYTVKRNGCLRHREIFKARDKAKVMAFVDATGADTIEGDLFV